MKTKLLILILLLSIIAEAQITKAETFLTGTKVSFYPNQCGNTIPEAAGKLTFCDGIENLGVVERSYGLNDRRVERMLPNHFNQDEMFVTSKGLSIRNTDGTWENIPNIAIPTFNAQGDWTNAGKVQNGLVLPDGKIIIQSVNGSIGPITHVYDRVSKTFTLIDFPNNRFPQLFVYDSDRGLTWILAFNSSDRFLYTFDGNSLSFVANITDIQGTTIQINSANLIYNQDNLYLGSINGLHKIDVSNYVSPPLPVTSYDSNTTPSLPFDRVSDLQFDSNGDLWLTQSVSGNGGIVKFDVVNDTYELYQLERENNATLNHSFETLAIDDLGTIWAAANTSSSLYRLDFPSNNETWNTITNGDLIGLGVPVTYVPSEIYFRNNQFYFTTVDFSSSSNSNYEVIINNDGDWFGRNDNAESNLSQRMNRRFTNVLPDDNGGVWWFNGYDDIVVYRDTDDNHQSILIENIGYKSAAIDTDNKAIVRGGSPNELRKIDFPNANSIQVNYNEANDMKRVSDQIWIYNRGGKKIEAYKDDALVHTYDLDEDWYLNAYYFAADDNGDVWFIRSYNGIEIKKFDTTTLTTTTYDVSSIGGLSTLRKVVAAPNGGVWFIGTLGAVYQENGVFYPFLNADHPELYYVVDIVVDTNGKAYLLNNDSASITTIENPTDANPVLTNTSIENENSVLPALDHYRPDALTIDSEGSIWTHASLNTFKLIDTDFATEYIPQPEVLNTTDVDLNNKIAIYPIPAKDILNVVSNIPMDSLELFDALGKRVLKTKSTQRLDLSQIKSGLYFLKIVSGNSVQTKKIIID
ncbi:T9SS type A sorting domain-containing protein [Psychroserpens sp. MEBiC05023]